MDLPWRGAARTKLEESGAGLLGVDLARSINEGGSGTFQTCEVVPEGGGALKGESDGGIGGVGGVCGCCEKPRMKGGHGGDGERVLTMDKAKREGGRLQPGARLPPLPLQGGWEEGFDPPLAMDG